MCAGPKRWPTSSTRKGPCVEMFFSLQPLFLIWAISPSATAMNLWTIPGGLISASLQWVSYSLFTLQTICHSVTQLRNNNSSFLVISSFILTSDCSFTRVSFVYTEMKPSVISWLCILFLNQVPIPVTSGLDPLTMLMDDADVATWQNEGLPADRMSTENATILTSCERWPLMVDPQLQGIKWIKNKYGENLRVIRIGQRG